MIWWELNKTSIVIKKRWTHVTNGGIHEELRTMYLVNIIELGPFVRRNTVRWHLIMGAGIFSVRIDIRLVKARYIFLQQEDFLAGRFVLDNTVMRIYRR